MKRWILAMAALLMTAVVLHAEYVVIRVNLAVSKERGGPMAGQQPPSNPLLQILQQRGRAPGGGGAGDMRRGGGGGGLQPGMNLNLNALAPGGQGNQNAQRGGNFLGGQSGIGNQPAQGEGGEGGPTRRLGGKGEGGMEGVDTQSRHQEVDSTPKWAQAIIEVKRNEVKDNPRLGYGDVKTKWGHTKVPAAVLDPSIETQIVSVPTVAERYADEWKKIDRRGGPVTRKPIDMVRKKLVLPAIGQPSWADPISFYMSLLEISARPSLSGSSASDRERKKNKTDEDKLVDLAKWALQHGIIDDVPKSDRHPIPIEGIPTIMEELERVNPEAEAVIAFNKVRSEMDGPIAEDSPLPDWAKELFRDLRPTSSKHYTLYSDVSVDADVNRHLDLLEHAYRTFYYWHAVRGIAHKVPKQRLVVIMPANADQFERWRKDVFDSTQRVDAGFYDAADRFVILAASDLDPIYALLDRVTESVLSEHTTQGWNKEKLLRGSKLLDFQWMHSQTLVLVRECMKEEAERAAVGFQGTRQLIEAIGLVPRAVKVPQWLEFGVPIFFATPRGSYWPGVGTTSSPYLENFKRDISTLEQNGRSHAEVLKAVVSDRGFRSVRHGPYWERSTLRARTMAWSLTTFLAEKKLDGFRHYLDELAKVPHDLEIDEDALVQAFARAYGLVTKTSEIDENALANFADTWVNYMKQIPVEVEVQKSQDNRRRGNTLRTTPQPRGEEPDSSR
jgi:hypothetical protein